MSAKGKSSSYFEEDDEEQEPTFSEDESEEEESEEEQEQEEDLEGGDILEDEEESEVDEEESEMDEEEDVVQNGGENEENEEDVEDEDVVDKKKRTKKIPQKTIYKQSYTDEQEQEEEEDDGEMYLQKFDRSLNENYLVNAHPECTVQNYDEILSMIKVVRDKDDIIIDDLHKTIPYLTKYERARILGQRARQIDAGSSPFIKVPENVIDGYIIAEMELKEKRIPFIIRRPLPHGGSEYWSIKDLEDISF
jgi:DNA-directed RNA polymerase I, II, and III subunit RPABC2